MMQNLILESDLLADQNKKLYEEPAKVVVSKKRTFEAASGYKGSASSDAVAYFWFLSLGFLKHSQIAQAVRTAIAIMAMAAWKEVPCFRLIHIMK